MLPPPVDEMNHVDPVWGPIIFFSLYTTLALLLFNILLSIMLDAYRSLVGKFTPTAPNDS